MAQHLSVAVIGGIGGGLVLAGVAVTANWRAIGQRFGPSCTVGVSGTAAKLTFEGWGASGSCDNQLASAGTYRYSGPTPNEPVICQYTIHDTRATVRDEGVLKLVGNVVCADLAKQVGR